MEDREQFTVVVGGMTLCGCLVTGGREPDDVVPSFISPGWLRSLEQRGLLTRAPSLPGATYHVELEGFWDDKEHRDLRVVASIDDGGLRAFLPFTDAFTISPSGSITEHSAL